jgi:hypothetical protein
MDKENSRGSSSGDDRIDRGLDLLRHMQIDSLTLSEIVDRIEMISSDPAITRSILEQATTHGILSRENGSIRKGVHHPGATAEPTVEQRTGEYQCRRCGSSLKKGYFLVLDSGEMGPFGPTCVTYLTGRDDY